MNIFKNKSKQILEEKNKEFFMILLFMKLYSYFRIETKKKFSSHMCLISGCTCKLLWSLE